MTADNTVHLEHFEIYKCVKFRCHYVFLFSRKENYGKVAKLLHSKYKDQSIL